MLIIGRQHNNDKKMCSLIMVLRSKKLKIIPLLSGYRIYKSKNYFETPNYFNSSLYCLTTVKVVPTSFLVLEIIFNSLLLVLSFTKSRY